MRKLLNENRPWIPAAVPIDIEGRDVVLNAYLCGTVERRLAFALGRFARRIQSIHVRLSELPSSPGGRKGCQIEMRVGRKAAILARASDARLDRAITKAAHVAARRLEELCKRKRGA